MAEICCRGRSGAWRCADRTKALRFDSAKLKAWVNSGCPDLRHGAATSGKVINRGGGRRGSRENAGSG